MGIAAAPAAWIPFPIEFILYPLGKRLESIGSLPECLISGDWQRQKKYWVNSFFFNDSDEFNAIVGAYKDRMDFWWGWLSKVVECLTLTKRQALEVMAFRG